MIVKHLGVSINNSRECFGVHKEKRMFVEKILNITFSVIHRQCNELLNGKTYLNFLKFFDYGENTIPCISSTRADNAYSLIEFASNRAIFFVKIDASSQKIVKIVYRVKFFLSLHFVCIVDFDILQLVAYFIGLPL